MRRRGSTPCQRIRVVLARRAPSPALDDRTALELEAHVVQRELLGRPIGEQHRRGRSAFRRAAARQGSGGHCLARSGGTGSTLASTRAALKNLNANINLNASTGTPYTITTGHDDNGDLVFNDRPAGVGRNTQWTPGQWTVNGFFNLHHRDRQDDGAEPRRDHRHHDPQRRRISVMTGGAAPPRYRIGHLGQRSSTSPITSTTPATAGRDVAVLPAAAERA